MNRFLPILLLALPLTGAEDDKVFRSDVSLVRVDAQVVDVNHRTIAGLRREDYDDDTKKVIGLVIRRGHVFTKDVSLPMRFVVEVVADIVRVDIDDDALSGLPEFKA